MPGAEAYCVTNHLLVVAVEQAQGDQQPLELQERLGVGLHALRGALRAAVDEDGP